MFDVRGAQHNLWHTLLLLLQYCRLCQGNRLCGVALDRTALNLNCITDDHDVWQDEV